VEYLDGRKLKLIQNSPRWIDDFTVPGQFIGVRGIKNGEKSNGDSAEELIAITSSPNEARVNSALLDATILEVIVDRSIEPEKDGLGYYAPGDVFEVTQALGRGFSSLFTSNVGLLTALEEKRGLLMVCYGSNGVGLMRSALNWSPVMALATAQQISCVLIAPSMPSATCVPEWDVWRQNGVKVIPLYETPNDGSDRFESENDIEKRLDDTLFGQPDSFTNLVKYPMECAVLMSGLPTSISSFLTKRLTEHGVSRERFLFCEFF